MSKRPMKIVIESENSDSETISALAYNLGRAMEEAILAAVGGAASENKSLHRKIISYYVNYMQNTPHASRYRKHFGIEERKPGVINSDNIIINKEEDEQG